MHKIIIIEDNKIDAQLLEKNLKQAKANLQPIFCRTFRESLDTIREEKDVKLILLDLNLPDNWGISSVRDLKAYCPRIPILVTTGIAGDLTIKESIKAGASGLMLKSSITPTSLARAIDNNAA